ncbi:MAG: hypothetical protein RL764_1302 [Pseudomonadota bacterium]|jgi:hypothetical protein
MIVGRCEAGITSLFALSPQLDEAQGAKACRVVASHPHYPHLGMNSLSCWQGCGEDKVNYLELRRLRLSRFFR